MTKYNIEINLAVNKAITSSSKLKSSLSNVETELKKITNATNSMATIMLSSMTKSTKKVDEYKKALKDSSAEAKKLGSQISKIGAILGVAGFGAGLVMLQRYSDGFTDMTNKIKALSAEGTNYAAIEEELFNVSQRSRTGLSETVQLYGRLSLAQKNLGTTQTEMLRFTEAIGKALVVSGAAANTQRGVLLQLSQAMGTDIVRAEEFNSILEGGIRIAQAAADGIEKYGGNIAKLRKAVIDGAVSSRELYEGILSQIPKIEKEFAKTSTTISQALTKMNNAMTMFVGNMDKATGVSRAFTYVLDGISSNLVAVFSSIAIGIAAAGGALIVKTLILITSAAASAAASTGLLAGALAGLKAAIASPIGLGVIALAGAFFLLKESKDEDTLATEQATRSLRILNSQARSNVIMTQKQATALRDEAKARLEVEKARYKEIIAKGGQGFESKVFASQTTPIYENMGILGKMFDSVGLGEAYYKINQKIDTLGKHEFKKERELIDLAKERLKIINETLDSMGDYNQKIDDAVESDRQIKLAENLELQNQMIKNLEKEQILQNTSAVQQGVLNNLLESGYEVTKDNVDEFGNLLEITDANALKIAEMTRGLTEFQEKAEKVSSKSSSPLKNWIEDASNLSENLTNTLIGALGATEDAIVEFAKTGEFSFSEFASSIIEDLARVMIRMSMAQAMMSAFGMGGGGLGSVFGFANGGYVSGAGTGTSDSIPAMLSNGEYVVNARSTQQFGPLLEAINRGPKFAKGGLVGSGSLNGSGLGGSNVEIEIIDQRGSNAPAIQTKTQTNSDGSKVIQMLIKAEVTKGISNGSFDSAMGASYGIKRASVKRG